MEDTIYLRGLTKDNIFEIITSDPSDGGYPAFQYLTYEDFEEELQNLLDTNRLLPLINRDGEIEYSVNTREVRDYTHLRLIMRSFNDISKVIYHTLTINQNKVFWTIKLGAQKTKTDQMIKAIKRFMSDISSKSIGKVIPFIFSLNDIDLSDQTMLRFLRSFNRHHIFILSCGNTPNTLGEDSERIHYINSKNLQSLKDHIELYVSGLRPMPIIISLPNQVQVKRVCSILEFICQLDADGKKCGYAHLYDEADAIYGRMRDEILRFVCSFENNDIVPHKCNLGQYYVSATLDEELLSDFPEIASAEQIPIHLDASVEPNYRNIDHADAKVLNETLHQKHNESNNDFILRVVTEHYEYFHSKNTQANGEEVYKRIIGIADMANSKQEALARNLAILKFASIIYNQSGFIIHYPYEDGYKTIRVRRNGISGLNLKGLEINKKLSAIYKHFPILSNFPIFILGNKKIDRGLSFHYAPRMGTDEAWLVSDIIMGYYKDDERRKACQVAARLWGIIAHRPEYVGYIGLWMDCRSREMVLRDARMTKHVQDNSIIPESFELLLQDAVEQVPNEVKYPTRNIKEVGPFPHDPNGHIITTSSDGVSIRIPKALVECLKKEIGFQRNLPTSFCKREGYIITTRIKHNDASPLPNAVNPIGPQHRFLLERIDTEEFRTKDDIQAGNSLNYSGKATDQNFVILPVYPDETTPGDDQFVQWFVRFEEPIKDRNGTILFVNDKVRYKDNIYTVCEVIPSLYGDRVKAKLKKSDNSLLEEENALKQKITAFAGKDLEKVMD